MKARTWKLIIFFGSLVSASLFVSAFYLVLVRGQISEDAHRIAKLEYQILEAKDTLRALEVTVDDSIQPHVLKARINGFLTLPYEGQVVRVKRSELEKAGSVQWVASSEVRSGEEGV